MRLSSQDASFLYGETASGPMHGSAIAVFDGEIPFKRIYDHIERRLHLVPRYRQRLVFVPGNLAHPRWVDDPDFELANHVRLHPLPAGSTEADAIARALRLGEALLDRSRPLWMTYVLEGVPGRTVLASLGHHAMVDGVSGVDLTMIIMDLSRDAPPPPPPEQPWRPQPLPGALELLEEAVRENLEALRAQSPFSFAAWRRLGERSGLLQTASQVMLRLLAEPVIGAPWNAGLVGPERRVAWSEHELAEFRAVRAALGGTINDIAVTVMTEAAARYLELHGERTFGQRMRLMCPVNVRREDEKGALGNRVSALFPTLPAWPMRPLERLRTVRDEMERLKSRKEAQALELLLESAPPIPPVAMAQTLWVGTPFDPTAWLARLPLPAPPRLPVRPPHFGYNFVLTNVPGPQVPLYLCGHEASQFTGAMMLTGALGLGVAVLSYNGRITFNLTCEPRLLPDVERLRDCAREVFAELLAEARARSSAAAAS